MSESKMALSFINNLEQDAKKVKHQRFTIKLGIEEFNVFIPFTNASVFENDVLKTKPEKQKELKILVEKYNGILRAK
jgi:hypothetical protein